MRPVDRVATVARGWVVPLGVSVVVLMAASGVLPNGAAATSGDPSVITVTFSASPCRVTPARVPAGAVLFMIRNGSRVAQRFTFSGRTSIRVGPGASFKYKATLDNPGVYPYKCIGSGSVRHGSLQVAHNVVVETDMDASDAMAIAYLLHRADVEVAAIVVDGDGEARCPAGATNALLLTALAGRTDIPVGCGRPLPLRGAHAFPTVWRDFVDNFFGLPRPDVSTRPPAGSGEQVIQAAIRSAPGRVEVLTLGPPTELAALLTAEPSLGARIRSVTMMGGAVGAPGNITWPPGVGNQYAEWNFYIDPHAANIVFRSGVPVTLVPLDATNAVPLNAAVTARLGGSPSAAFVRNLVTSLLPTTTLYFWDPLAAAVLVEPAVGSYANKQLAVIEDEGPESGRVVAATGGSQIRVAINANQARFESSFTSTLH